MNRINKYLLKYLLFSFPAVLIMFVWGCFQGQWSVMNSGNGLLYLIWEILAWNLILWFLILIYIFFVLIISSKFREVLLSNLSGIKIRDERENYIAGVSGRVAFFSTLSVLILLLFFSTISFSISKLPVEKSINGKQNELSIDCSFNFFDKTKIYENKEVIFSTYSFPLSKQTILIFLIIWHLGTFFYSSRRMMKNE